MDIHIFVLVIAQGDQYPTINTFVLFYTEIVDRLRKVILYNDDDVITSAARILLDNMDKRLPLTDLSIGAAIIDPNMQRLPTIEDWLASKGMLCFFSLLFQAIFFIPK